MHLVIDCFWLVLQWAVGVKCLTCDRGCVVWSVSPQVLCGLGGWLRQALRAPTVTHTEKHREEEHGVFI